MLRNEPSFLSTLRSKENAQEIFADHVDTADSAKETSDSYESSESAEPSVPSGEAFVSEEDVEIGDLI